MPVALHRSALQAVNQRPLGRSSMGFNGASPQKGLGRTSMPMKSLGRLSTGEWGGQAGGRAAPHRDMG